MKRYDIKLKFTQIVAEPERAVPANTPEEVVKYMTGAFDEYPQQESFWVLLLNRKNYIMGRQMITLGTATNTLAHPREVFRAAIIGGAAAIICVHNHPSGDPSPSAADIRMTRQLREASQVIDIQLLDHIVIGDKAIDPCGLGYHSFRSVGMC